MAKTFRFEVIEGIHEEGIGDTKMIYKKGEEFETTLPLDTMYANKFKKVLTKKQQKAILDAEVEEEENQVKEKVKGKTPKKVTKKTDKNKDGDAEENLDEPLREGDEVDEENEASEEDEDEETEDEDEETEDEETVNYGEEVTDQFSKAVDNQVKVYKSDKGYTVLDPERPSIAMNKTVLKNKKMVISFLVKTFKSK